MGKKGVEVAVGIRQAHSLRQYRANGVAGQGWRGRIVGKIFRSGMGVDAGSPAPFGPRSAVGFTSFGCRKLPRLARSGFSVRVLSFAAVLLWGEDQSERFAEKTLFFQFFEGWILLEASEL